MSSIPSRPFAPIVLNLPYKSNANSSPRALPSSDAPGMMPPPPPPPSSSSLAPAPIPKVVPRPRTNSSSFSSSTTTTTRPNVGGYDYYSKLQESGEFGLRLPNTTRDYVSAAASSLGQGQFASQQQGQQQQQGRGAASGSFQPRITTPSPLGHQQDSGMRSSGALMMGEMMESRVGVAAAADIAGGGLNGGSDKPLAAGGGGGAAVLASPSSSISSSTSSAFTPVGTTASPQATAFAMSNRAREADSKLQHFYESNVRTFQACETLLRDSSKMIAMIDVRAHIVEAKIVSLFDPTLEEELAKARAAVAAFDSSAPVSMEGGI